MRAAARVSANEGVVLGMLAGSPGSGYDLLRRIRRSVGYFWTPARSHIYSLLPALAAAGLARAEEVEQKHLPAKRVYEITPAGRDALVDWLASPELSEGPARNSFLVKLYFGDLLPREEIAAHIRDRRERIEAELAELEELERTIDGDASPFGFLALQYGLEVDRAILHWADAALRSLGDA